MAAHRYWRASFTDASPLILSEFQLLAGTTRVDAAATLTSSRAPVAGSLSALADDLATADASWLLASAVSLQWDFGGSPQEVTDIRLGASINSVGFPGTVVLEYSDDGSTWVRADTFVNIVWPGPRVKTASEQLGNMLKASAETAASGVYAWPVSAATWELADYGGVWVPPCVGGGLRQVEFTRTGSTLSLAVGFSSANARGRVTGGGTASFRFSGAVSYQQSGSRYLNSAFTAGVAPSWTASDTIGAVMDMSTRQVTFYKNGASATVFGAPLVVDSQPFPGIWTENSSGPANRAPVSIRTRGFTYPIAGATAWEDRWRIVTANTPMEAPMRAGVYAPRVVAAPERTSFEVKPIRLPLRLWKDWTQPSTGLGLGKITSTTKDKVAPGNIVPYSALVYLVRERDMAVVGKTLSNAAGQYQFLNIDETESYTVLAYYAAHGKRAVVADGLTLANGGVALMS